MALLSLLIMPSWPREWLGARSRHLNYTPLLSWFGPILLLALIRWREPGARLLLGLALVPQRLLYDQVALWLVPTTPRGSLLLTVASWIGMLARLLTEQGPGRRAGSVPTGPTPTARRPGYGAAAKPPRHTQPTS